MRLFKAKSKKADFWARPGMMPTAAGEAAGGARGSRRAHPGCRSERSSRDARTGLDEATTGPAGAARTRVGRRAITLSRRGDGDAW